MEDLRANNSISQTTHYELAYLIDEYGTSVYRFCRSLTYSKEDAEDLFQETFLRALEQPEKIEARENPKNFLFGAALYLWKSWKRKYARRKRLAPTEQLNGATESGINIEESYLILEENMIVRKLVENLPNKYKIPTILYYTLEMSIPNIAEIICLPVGTVKSRLYKARKLVEKGLIAIEYEK